MQSKPKASKKQNTMTKPREQTVATIGYRNIPSHLETYIIYISYDVTI